MAKFALIVTLEVKADSVDAFLEAAKGQADNSVRLEPGCLQFDIVRSLDEPTKITHYEIFEDAAAFEAHTKMPHTAAFGAKIQPLIVNNQMVRGEIVDSRTK